MTQTSQDPFGVVTTGDPKVPLRNLSSLGRETFAQRESRLRTPHGGGFGQGSQQEISQA
jgi:hypothetical protein